MKLIQHVSKKLFEYFCDVGTMFLVDETLITPKHVLPHFSILLAVYRRSFLMSVELLLEIYSPRRFCKKAT